MDKLSFAPYDFFGYLTCGFAFLAGLQMAFGFPPVLGRQLTLIDSLFLLLAVYVVGHVLATPAKAFLEDVIVHRVLNRPSVNLFRERKPTFRGIFFPGYYQPLSKTAQEAVRERVRAEGGRMEGEDLFVHVRFSQELRRDQALMARL